MRRRPNLRARAATFALIAVLILPFRAAAQSTPPQQDEIPAAKPHVVSQAADAVFLRPLGFVVLCVGSAMFVPVAIVTAPGGMDNLEEALDFFVIRPYEEVFVRPLGEF